MCERLFYRQYDARTVVPRGTSVRYAELKFSNFLKWGGLFILSFLMVSVSPSEFPERECCDPIYPPNTATTPSAPVTHPVSKPGPGVKGAMAILNCLLARQLCFEDASCSAILEIIPRVCGSELVACSTVTVTKCQAALRTLQAFPFFKPTCLCREPNVDPECNSFRDFLFDHPCVFVMKKEKDPYPVETLPTCTYALSVCHNERACSALFDRFKNACKARDGECRMDDRDACREAWAGLRLSPLFGCICPNTHMKKRCDRIFAVINHNPCVEAWASCPAEVRALFAAPARARAAGRAPAAGAVTRYAAADGTLLLLTENGTRLLTRAAAAGLLRAALLSPRHHRPHHTRHAKLIADGRGNRNGTAGGGAWVGGMSITHDGNLIAPDRVVDHVHRYHSPHYNPRAHHHHWKHEPGGSDDPLYATKTVYGAGYIDDNKRIGKEKGRVGDDDRTKALQSTCHVALDTCIKDGDCVTALTPVLQKCHVTECDREGCMAALRSFYRRPDVEWNVDIAFCLCKKTDNKEDSCLNAQERLHPSCAQRPPLGSALPACHTLAHACREEEECRRRLEKYEQWCAVDAVTQGCAGAPARCREAVMDVLGTKLRAACACRGTDFAQLYDCLGWQRLLWLNPCVLESQSDYHMRKFALLTTTPSDSVVKYMTVAPEPAVFHKTTDHHRHAINHESSQIVIPQENKGNMENPTTTMSDQTVIPREIAQISEPVIVETTTETTTVPTTTTTATTRSTTTTTTTPKPTTTLEPSKYCVVKKPEYNDEAQYIKMGETRRVKLYRSAELAECTDLCVCEPTLQVSCKAACVPRAPCSSRLAHYSHAAPAYQAYRGRCFCYSGSFICMRPNPGEYKLPEGVYLLLGFSSVDEALLRPHTGLGAEDAVRLLQQYLYSVHDQGTNCTLTLYNISNENVIISASVPPREQESLKEAGESLLDREKEECIDVLKVVKTRINTQHEDISSHLLLSIFKIAEVDVVYPAPPSSADHVHRADNTMILLALTLILLYNLNILPTFIYHRTNLSVSEFSVKNLDLTEKNEAIVRPSRNIFRLVYNIYRMFDFDEIYYKFIVVKLARKDTSTTHVAQAYSRALRTRYELVISDYIHIMSCDLHVNEHIIKAVSITIYNFNELDANAIILPIKYFSSDVFYDRYIVDILESAMLYGMYDFLENASSSYGIMKSVSLGLNLEVV